MLLGLTPLQCYVAIVAVFAVVYLFTPRKSIWIPFAVTTVLFAIYAYHIAPDPMDDLSVYFHHMDIFRETGRDGIQYALDENWFEWRTYRVSLYYIYIISQLPNNHFLPAITMFIVYATGFGVLYKAANRFHVNKTNLFFAAFFFISTYWYYDTASGTRNGLAFAVAIACTYQHLVERKHIFWCFVGYICAALTHSSGFLPVVIAILAAVTYKSKSKVIKYFLIFGLAGGGALFEFLATVTDNPFVQSVAGRAENHTSSGELKTSTWFVISLATFIFVALLLAYFSKYFVDAGKKSDNIKRFYKYSCVLVYFLIGCIFSWLIFVRFARWIIPLVGALIIMFGFTLQEEQEKNYKMQCFEKNTFPKVSIILKLRPVVYILCLAISLVSVWYAVNASSLWYVMFE